MYMQKVCTSVPCGAFLRFAALPGKARFAAAVALEAVLRELPVQALDGARRKELRTAEAGCCWVTTSSK